MNQIPNLEKVQYNVIDHQSLQKFVNEKLGTKYYFNMHTQAWEGDGVFEFDVKNDSSDSDLILKNLKWESRIKFYNYQIMNYLCFRGILPEGKLLVKYEPWNVGNYVNDVNDEK